MECDHRSSVIPVKKELRERKILLLPHGTSAFMYFILIVLNDSKFSPHDLSLLIHLLISFLLYMG